MHNHYPSSAPAHQVPHSSHSSHPPEEFAPPYPDPSHHSTLSYAAVNPATHLPAGSIAAQNMTPQYSYSPFATSPSPNDHRPYYTTSTQGNPIEHYATPSSPAGSYATPTPSGHLGPQAGRHHAHFPPQPQQQFIPTPSQTYLYSSPGSAASSGRSRSTVEPYYHMSPNPQHVVHAPPASSTHATGGTGGRSNTAHGPGLPHSHHAHPHPHAPTHTGTIVVATGERYSCDLCDRSFTRLHDRRRHYETVHATSPVLHKCRYCRKDFSRADSLKRHIDNGCDERPR